MALRAGIVGLPNVGKSSLFNALSLAGAEASNYAFCTIEPNVGIVEVPDARLQKLAAYYNPQRIVPAAVEFVDIAGLVKGASQGEGLGNKFLTHIREVDAIVHVVRCFEDADVVHVHESVDPIRDIEIIETELVLSDLESAERQLDRAQKAARGDKKLQPRADLLAKIIQRLDAGISLRAQELTEDECVEARGFFLLTGKPVLYACNVAESDLARGDELDAVRKVADYAATHDAEALAVSAKVESEIAQLEGDERALFLEELGVTESGLDRLIRKTFHLLGLMTYFTAGEKEVRAWTIPLNSKAPQAAAAIHSDFEKGFIRAEVTSYDDIMTLGGPQAAREAGKMRVEGKEYVVRDGDVCNFRVSV